MVVAGLWAPAAHAQPAAPTATEQPLRPTLPAPTGHHRIGVVQLHLLDHTRPDPWVPAQPVRELMVSLWYPAQRTHGYPLAPWLPPAAWARFEQDNGIPQGVLQVPLTHGAVGAPVDRDRGGRPVVLYSPGFGGTRDSGTILVEELVSRGYIVATIDHTHDATAVEFPDGRVETRAIPDTPEAIEQAVAVRVADTRFVLDTLTALNAGTNPDAEHRRLPVRAPRRAATVQRGNVRPLPRRRHRRRGHARGSADHGRRQPGRHPVRAGRQRRPGPTVPAGRQPRTTDATTTSRGRSSGPTCAAGDSTCN